MKRYFWYPDFTINKLGKDGATKSDEFSEKSGEGSFSIKKFMLQILGTLNSVFWANGRWPPPTAPQTGSYLWKSCACISYYLALVPLCINSTISIMTNLQHNFPKMRAVWNFSENSSDFAQPSFPKKPTKQFSALGKVSRQKVPVLLDFVQIILTLT